MLFDVYRLFNGEVTTCHSHSVLTFGGFQRTIRKYPTGNGHGFKVVIEADDAKRLGLTETNGVLFDQEGAFCLGEIIEP